MFDRLELLIGNIDFLKNKTVLLIGLGGVGGHAFEALVRSGIGRIIVIDNDRIDITNLNRQALAFQNTIGIKKVDVAYNVGKNINPNCEIIKIDKFVDETNIDEILNEKIDFVIDAIDSIKSKILIIKKCLSNNIKIISVMGTANKMHPELLEITDIKNTSYDPIARIIRKEVKGNLPVIYSKEEPLIKDKLGSNAFVPPAAGLLAVSYVINEILGDKNE